MCFVNEILNQSYQYYYNHNIIHLIISLHYLSLSFFFRIHKNIIDGQRCGETLLELFQTAKDPDNIVVSLVEQNQNTDDDLYCLEVYCKLAGGGKDSIYERIKPRNDSIKLIIKEEERNKCPRNDQIRLIKVNDIFTKGPTWARALGRKNLGNEEFCLQTATHNSFVQHWDKKVRKEWLLTNNEYAIISNQPKKQPTIQNDMQNTPDRIVPRNCAVDFLEIEKLPVRKYYITVLPSRPSSTIQ